MERMGESFFLPLLLPSFCVSALNFFCLSPFLLLRHCCCAIFVHAQMMMMTTDRQTDKRTDGRLSQLFFIVAHLRWWNTLKIFYAYSCLSVTNLVWNHMTTLIMRYFYSFYVLGGLWDFLTWQTIVCLPHLSSNYIWKLFVTQRPHSKSHLFLSWRQKTNSELVPSLFPPIRCRFELSIPSPSHFFSHLEKSFLVR